LVDIALSELPGRKTAKNNHQTREPIMRPAISVAPSPQAEDKGANPIGLTWVEVDLDAIAHNVRSIKNYVGSKVELIAVVKANAYGHGAVPVAHTVLQNGATRLAIYRLTEGIELRQAGLTAPILILGYTLPSEAEAVVHWNLTPTVNEHAQAQALSAAAARHGKRLPIHVKVDTGLGRFGLLPEEVVPFCQAVVALPWLELEGFYTHFAVADEPGESSQAYTHHQLDVYLAALGTLVAHGITVPLRHTAHSAALLKLPASHLDAVRPGIALYGLSPFANSSSPIPLHPALTLKSQVIRLRTLPAGASIGYGRAFITQRPTKIALVPVGYGDGYPRLLSNQGQVLIHGRRAPILGRVSMDQIVVDVSAIPGVEQHDHVVLLGHQTEPWGQTALPAEEVAAWAKTINYELITGLLPRVPRIYLSGGQPIIFHQTGGRNVNTGEKAS
jgi:alanine racemase